MPLVLLITCVRKQHLSVASSCCSLLTRDLGFKVQRSYWQINFFFLKYILLIMLLQLSFFFSPLYPSACMTPASSDFPHSSCPWVIHISSLASPFPLLFLTSPCLFCAYQLCFLFPVPFLHSPLFSPLITLHVISISVILFLFYLFA